VEEERRVEVSNLKSEVKRLEGLLEEGEGGGGSSSSSRVRLLERELVGLKGEVEEWRREVGVVKEERNKQEGERQVAMVEHQREVSK